MVPVHYREADEGLPKAQRLTSMHFSRTAQYLPALSTLCTIYWICATLDARNGKCYGDSGHEEVANEMAVWRSCPERPARYRTPQCLEPSPQALSRGA